MYIYIYIYIYVYEDVHGERRARRQMWCGVSFAMPDTASVGVHTWRACLYAQTSLFGGGVRRNPLYPLWESYMSFYAHLSIISS